MPLPFPLGIAPLFKIAKSKTVSTAGRNAWLETRRGRRLHGGHDAVLHVAKPKRG
ncbi:hypothetical protein [Chromobacterium vaccinii]|uniref:hypothetical protein n=1 Tax=Chromobacterium vaccinii TaxID=1108595 RepID=UPI0016425C34|nr:hypothetical protein [Chromobacterium vaccinii]